MSKPSNTKPIFKIGDVVSLKTHPLSYQENGLIFSHPNYIPPFMCIKEIHVERKKKIFSPHSNHKQIADKVKYLCVYFSQRNFKFEEKFVYESMLLKLTEDNFVFHKNEDEKTENTVFPPTTLIYETNGYKNAKYEYGKRVFFKTYKLELRKKFKQSEYKNDEGKLTTFSQKYSFIHTSPALIINGFKENENQKTYDEKTGDLLKEVAKELFQVMYYNEKQEKFSYEYLPKDFLIDEGEISE